MVTRSKAGVVKPNPRHALTTAMKTILEPLTIKEALSHQGWLKAMKEELATLDCNNTWELVPKTKDMHIIGAKWEFKLKYTADNTVERLKAKLVAKGYNQKDGVDYSEMFSPIVKPAIVGMALSLSTVKQ